MRCVAAGEPRSIQNNPNSQTAYFEIDVHMLRFGFLSSPVEDLLIRPSFSMSCRDS